MTDQITSTAVPIEYKGANATANGAINFTSIGPWSTATAPYIEPKARWIAVQFTAAASATVSFQISNDNVNWTALSLTDPGSSGAFVTSVTPAAGALYHGPVPARYFRLNISGYVSGTISTNVQVFQDALQTVSTQAAVQTASPSNADGVAVVSTNTVQQVDALGYAFNGTTFDRVRNSAGAGAGTMAVATASGIVPQNSLTAAAATGAGTAISMGAARQAQSVSVTGAFVGTLRLQGSHDGANWFDLAVVSVSDTAAAKVLDITAPGIYVSASPMPINRLRANVTAYTSGAITALVAGA